MRINRTKPTSPGLSVGYTLLLALFSSLILAGGFLLQGSLYWDTSRIFPQFRDNLHALNQFGEIAWWLPHNQMGSPGYYHSILGIPSCVTPPFVLLGLVCFLLGKLGIIIPRYQPIYVGYFGLLLPTLFLFALRSVLQKCYVDARVLRYLLILAAFSPGIAFNLSDVGYLEPTIYALCFVSACLSLLEEATRARKFYFLLTTLCLGLSFNHAFLYWNLFALPTFFIFLWIAQGKPKRIHSGFLKLSLLGILCFFIGALPNLIAQSQGSELIRSSLGLSKSYPLEKLAAGNPLEMLSISTPGFGFDWDILREKWTLMALSKQYHTAYYYLGLLALPLCLLALLYANLPVRISLFALCIFYFGILPLSAHSPFFAPLLAIPSPLRSCNHFSDAGFKAGSYLFLMLGAGYGLQLLAGNRRKKEFFYLFLGCTSLSIGTHFFLLGKSISENLSSGILFFSALLYFLVLIPFLEKQNKKQSQWSVGLLLALTLFDVSTHSFLWVRNILDSRLTLNSGWRAIHRMDETPGEANIGLRNGADNHYYANTLLILKPYYEMLLGQFNPYALPPLKLYFKSHPQGKMRDELSAYATSRGEMPSLPLAHPFSLERTQQSRNRAFLGAPKSSDEIPIINVTRRTYSTLQVSVTSPASALLFIRDAYSPYWKAHVNGMEVPVLQAFYNFKAIPISKGQQTVSLAFKPTGVGLAIFSAYFFFFTLVSAWLICRVTMEWRNPRKYTLILTPA